MSEKKKIKIEPIDPAITIVRVVHDQWSRDFRGEKWPSEATVEECENYLWRTGLFREAKKAKEKDVGATGGRPQE